MGLCRTKVGIKTLHKTKLQSTFDIKKLMIFSEKGIGVPKKQ